MKGAASNDAMGTMRTQASTQVIGGPSGANAGSNSTLGGQTVTKPVGGGTTKGARTSGMASPFKEALQKGVVSGVGMLTF